MTKTALITGATGAIGAALCTRFANDGFAVLALDKVRPTVPSPCRFVDADLDRFATDAAYRDTVLHEIRGALPPTGLDVLINNAAVQRLGSTATLAPESWHETLNVNVTAPFLLVQGMLRELEAARGCVVNITSVHAHLTKPEFAAYATSKAALEGLTRALAVDLGPAVRVNGIAPAAIDTQMLRAGFADPQALAALKRFHPVGDIGTPEQVASVAAAIVAADLRFLSGSIVRLDGGIGARLHDPV